MTFLNRLSGSLLAAICGCAVAVQGWVPPVVVSENSLRSPEMSVRQDQDNYTLYGRLLHSNGADQSREYAHVKLVTAGDVVQQEWNVPLKQIRHRGPRLSRRGRISDKTFRVEIPKPIPEGSSIIVTIRSGSVVKD